MHKKLIYKNATNFNGLKNNGVQSKSDFKDIMWALSLVNKKNKQFEVIHMHANEKKSELLTLNP